MQRVRSGGRVLHSSGRERFAVSLGGVSTLLRPDWWAGPRLRAVIGAPERHVVCGARESTSAAAATCCYYGDVRGNARPNSVANEIGQFCEILRDVPQSYARPSAILRTAFRNISHGLPQYSARRFAIFRTAFRDIPQDVPRYFAERPAKTDAYFVACASSVWFDGGAGYPLPGEVLGFLGVKSTQLQIRNVLDEQTKSMLFGAPQKLGHVGRTHSRIMSQLINC
ncbi:microtubule motor [Branchiostoma belcheri]|nr:microtubule motor [Branchiostoma belcheri]